MPLLCCSGFIFLVYRACKNSGGTQQQSVIVNQTVVMQNPSPQPNIQIINNLPAQAQNNPAHTSAENPQPPDHQTTVA